MKMNEAISTRIIELANKRNWSIYRLSYESGLPNSTLSNVVLCKCNGCNTGTIMNICRGVNITAQEFFASPMFDPKNIDDD